MYRFTGWSLNIRKKGRRGGQSNSPRQVGSTEAECSGQEVALSDLFPPARPPPTEVS